MSTKVISQTINNGDACNEKEKEVSLRESILAEFHALRNMIAVVQEDPSLFVEVAVLEETPNANRANFMQLDWFVRACDLPMLEPVFDHLFELKRNKFPELIINIIAQGCGKEWGIEWLCNLAASAKYQLRHQGQVIPVFQVDFVEIIVFIEHLRLLVF